MNPELLTQIYQTWAHHFQLPLRQFSTPGTTFYVHEPSEAESFFTLWPLGDHVIVEVIPADAASVREITARFPDTHRLSYQDIQEAWGEVEHLTMILYALDPASFCAFPLDPRYELRLLTHADQPAFEAFEAQCPQDDRDECDIGMKPLKTYAVFDGARIAAVSCEYIWRGFVDISILTDPHYRGKGLGKAAVSAGISHCLHGDKVIGYRHNGTNLPSQRIALALGFRCYAVVDLIKPPQ